MLFCVILSKAKNLYLGEQKILGFPQNAIVNRKGEMYETTKEDYFVNYCSCGDNAFKHLLIVKTRLPAGDVCTSNG